MTETNRVGVFDGSGKNFLGHGSLVGFVDVYVIDNEDGSISSNKFAEDKPVGVPDDKIRIAKRNPKIILDSGITVYGCQVWWSYVTESEEIEQKRAFGVSKK